MKVQSFEIPNILEAVGNGSYRYRWNIKEVIPEEKDATPYWAYEEVIVWAGLSANRILQAVIADLWDSNYEQKLINDYYSAVLGMYDEDVAQKKMDAYKQFLQERQKIKAQIDNDCKDLGIV